jgi:hypothetical protein
VIACEGYRVVGLGHHQTTFQALETAMGRSVVSLSCYFELCRRQRNQVDYDMANVATEAEARLLVEKAKSFDSSLKLDSQESSRSRSLRFGPYGL